MQIENSTPERTFILMDICLEKIDNLNINTYEHN